jgi:hypothetical protein
MSLQPADPETFSASLKTLLSPTDDDVRHPLEFIVPTADVEKVDDKTAECADKAFYSMMGYVKMLQKHYSDLLMTTKIKEFSPEESILWEKHRFDIMLKLVEHFSIIEFVRLFPHMTKEGDDGKVQFDLTAFSPFAKQGKDGAVYIDEYALNKAHRQQAKDHKRADEAHCDYDVGKGRILTEDEVREQTVLLPAVVEEVVEEEEAEEEVVVEKQSEVPEVGKIFLE